MSIQDWCAIIVAVVGAGTGVVGVIVAINRVYIRLTLVETRLNGAVNDIDTLQIYLLKRGAAEVVQKKLGTLNSPLVFHPEVTNWFMGLTVANEIRNFVKRNEAIHDIPESKLAFEIEKEFGDQLIKEICIPKGVTMGACLMMVLDIVHNDRRTTDVGHFPDRRKNA